jgi:outer membrane lipoprotein-sorting protein
MKNVVRHSLLYFGFLLSVVIASAMTASAQQPAKGPLGQVLDRLDSFNKSLQSVQADVTMLKHNPQLGTTDTYIGSTSYLPKARGKMYVRLDWKKPSVENMVVIGEDYKLYKPSINQLYVGKTNQAKSSAGAGNALAFMNMSKDQLKANYTIAYLGEESAAGQMTWKLQLTPKAAANYKSAELWVAPNGMPVQAKVLEQTNDTTTVILANIKENQTINVNIFALPVPKNVKTIKV